jgi:hypothetical protein
VTIRATATDETRVVSTEWEVIARPPMSTVMPVPTNRPQTRLTPDRQGRYRLRFTARDTDGLASTCEVDVVGLPTPPEAICPMAVETVPLTEVTLTGEGIDDGTIVRYQWRLVSSEPGSAAEPPRPATGPTTRFLPDIVGQYEIELRVTDDDGETDSCVFVVRAIATEGLRVEMFWDTDGTDMDTHLLSPEGTRWFTDTDCYYGNCDFSSGDVLEWYDPGPDDNPRLDIDNTTGFGPENINVDEPEPGTYRVGIHAFRGSARVTVRIYCGGSTDEPRQTFGPVSLSGRGASFDNHFWRVADVEITRSGGCRITDLAVGGRPHIRPATDAQTSR